MHRRTLSRDRLQETAMTIRLNHTIVAAGDRDASAVFLTEILGLPAPSLLGPFAVVQVGDTSLDYMDVRENGADAQIEPQHYAFLVSESEFDEIFERIRERHLPYWADPGRRERGHINSWDDGRGLYFEDLNGHLLEIITRPYGSGGTVASRPHPLVARTRAATDHPGLGRQQHQKSGGARLAASERPDRRSQDG
jgi:catechol 2,3-dioxygenase-like lactoylglutathione lyase family enzyme